MRRTEQARSICATSVIRAFNLLFVEGCLKRHVYKSASTSILRICIITKTIGDVYLIYFRYYYGTCCEPYPNTFTLGGNFRRLILLGSKHGNGEERDYISEHHHHN